MFLTIMELRKGIQCAKEQLIEEVVAWMNGQGDLFTQEEKENWLNSVNVATRDVMQDGLKANNFPFGRYDTVEEQSSVETPSGSEKEMSALSLQEPKRSVMIAKSVYRPYGDCNSAVLRLCHLTTLLDQLYQLDDLLSPIEVFVDIQQLQWAHSMTDGICNQLRFAKVGVDTLEYYRQNLQTAWSLYIKGKQNNLQAFELFDEQLHARREQFVTTLRCFVDTLSETYALVEDKRFWFIRSLSAYLPWHGMLHQLAINLFEKDGVIHPDHKLLQIHSIKLDMLSSLFVQDQQKTKTKLQLQHMNECDEIDLQVKEINAKLNSMASNISVLQCLASRRNSALFIKPTSMLGLLGFFQTLNAIHGTVNQSRIAEDVHEYEKTDEHTLATSSYSTASSSSAW